MVREPGLGNGNASLPCAGTELLQQGRRAQQRSPCDLGAPAQILILLKLMELDGGNSSCAPPVGHETKGWSKMIPDGSCWYSLCGELNHSLTSLLLCAAKTVTVTVKGEKGHSEGRLKRSEAQIDVFKAGQSGRCPSGNSSCLHLLSCAVAVTNISPPTSPA